MMPGMNGSATARELVSRCGQSAPLFVATSASALSHEQRQFREAGFVDVLIKPLRCERVLLSLTTLLGVDFEAVHSTSAESQEFNRAGGDLGFVARQRTDAPVSNFTNAGLDGTALPDGLRVRLREAAEMYSITSLKEILVEIERLGPKGAPMAANLRRLMKKYDLQSIARFAGEPAEEAGVGRA